MDQIIAMNNFTKEEITLLKLLVEDRLEENYNGPEGIEIYWKPEILLKIWKKLEKLDG